MRVKPLNRLILRVSFVFLFLVFCFPPPAVNAVDATEFELARRRMIERDIRKRGVKDEVVLRAMAAVPRHEFVPPHLRHMAYADRPLPIKEGQTISQPFIVAYMTELLGLKRGDSVYEVGTGSGYQAAVLAEITPHVYSIEIKEPLALSAGKKLKELGYTTVRVKAGDGYKGWPEYAPFDAIIITAAADHIPQLLLAQLKDGGRLVLPLEHESGYQILTRITREGSEYLEERLMHVRFVPMTGQVLEK